MTFRKSDIQVTEQLISQFWIRNAVSNNYNGSVAVYISISIIQAVEE